MLQPEASACRVRARVALVGCAALLATAFSAAPAAEAQTRAYVDTRTGEVIVFHGPEVAGTQTGVRSDGTVVESRRDAAGGEVWRRLDGSGELRFAPGAGVAGQRTAIDSETGELRVIQEP